MNNCQWFTSFDLPQGYLQMPVAKSDIHKTAFRAGSSSLYEFTHMPFRLSNSGSSFCHLMEMCLGDQLFVMLLLYLDDICVFVASIDEMLDQIELVFSRLKEFNPKLKPKKCHFFQQRIVFLGCVLSACGISTNLQKVDAVKYWPVPRSAKELYSFLGLASYYCCFIPKFAAITKCLHVLVGPTNVKRKPKKETEAIAITDSDKKIQLDR